MAPIASIEYSCTEC